MNWVKYKNRKPTEAGLYMFALNHWRATDLAGNPVHTYSVSTAFFNGICWKDGDHTLIDPCHWARIPFPEAAYQP